MTSQALLLVAFVEDVVEGLVSWYLNFIVHQDELLKHFLLPLQLDCLFLYLFVGYLLNLHLLHLVFLNLLYLLPYLRLLSQHR